jgi:hypothetical protein
MFSERSPEHSDFILNRSSPLLTKIVWRISPHTVKGFSVLLATYSKKPHYINKYTSTFAHSGLRLHEVTGWTVRQAGFLG